MMQLIKRWRSQIRLKASRKRYEASQMDTWEKVWPNEERGPNGLYLLYRTNGNCPYLEPIINQHKSIILWCN